MTLDQTRKLSLLSQLWEVLQGQSPAVVVAELKPDGSQSPSVNSAPSVCVIWPVVLAQGSWGTDPEWSQDLLVPSLDEATSEVTGRSRGQKRHQVTEQSPPGLVKRKVVLIIRQKAGLAKCSKRTHDSRFDESGWRNIKQGEQKCSQKQNLK